MIDLEDKYVEFIKKTIQDVLPDAEIFIFGSRTQGRAHEYSDVDIALNGNIPFADLLKLKAIFEDSIFPYKVDIVDLANIKPEFFKIIEKDLVKLDCYKM